MVVIYLRIVVIWGGFIVRIWRRRMKMKKVVGVEERIESESEYAMEREICKLGMVKNRKRKKVVRFWRGFGLLGAQGLDLRDVVVRREEKRSEREFVRNQGVIEREEKRREMEWKKDTWQNEREEEVESREIELQERELKWGSREYERRVRIKMELDEERRRRTRIEEKIGGVGDGMV
ncbi:hypothetical protein Patl1_21205 [Pistacia atlantica]|uniref:Uncharacterized protein n=1 Tax=Pistacia atlantica TaxID=434234 RepID=A0ACC1BMP6_9ROSI|nr:hypothetical protein Patl1_21205 [Pistacia atlantica]